MWNKSQLSTLISSSDADELMRPVKPAIIESVEIGSIGEEVGFEPGDKILSINGIKPRDIIDYQFLISEEVLNLKIIDQLENIHTINIEKEINDNLGISFKDALFDELKQCNNACPFCFIDQQPKGKRRSLYLKDDDYRMSFLYGSYLTLTNLNQQDWDRIENQRLSPLYVSVHSTNPSLRAKLLKNPKAGFIMHQIQWFAERKLQIHAQIVVCPGINDRDALKKSLLDLAKYASEDWPTVLSAAVVPVGLTRFRPEGDGLYPVDPKCAKNVIFQVEKMQNYFLSLIGSRFVWLSDEWYLIAGETLPPRCNYEDLPQQENGVGSIRSFLEAIDNATKNLPESITQERTCSWVVGQLVEKSLQPACKRLNSIIGLSLNLYGLPSPYWGQDQIVTGLLTGEDLLKGLNGKELGEELLLPSVMLKEGEPVFLDDMKLSELSKSLDISIRIVNGANDIVSAVLGESHEIL